MKMVAIYHKQTKEFLRLAPVGEMYMLPAGVSLKDIDMIPIGIPVEGEVDEIISVEDDQLLEKAARHFGMCVADFIEAAARALSIEPCSSCFLRKRILYEVHRLGWFKALRLIWKTIRADLRRKSESKT